MHRIGQALGLSVALFVLLEWAEALTAHYWDWDINHMMYFGQRLLAGDLHWTVEFDDKLPVNQFLFAIPAAFESFRVWLIMSILSMSVAAWAVYWLINELLRPGPLVPKRARLTSGVIGALATLCGYAVAPGGMYHINPMASAAAIVAIALLMRAGCPPQGSHLARTLFILSALCASLATGLRPYFLLPLCAVPFWIALRDRRNNVTTWGALATGMLWIGVFGAFGLVANVLPYLIVGDVEALRAGLGMLSEKLNPQGVFSIAHRQYEFLLWKSNRLLLLIMMLSLIASGLAAANLLNRGRRQQDCPAGGGGRVARDTLVLTLVLPGLLEVMIFKRHFWSHYIQMFVPFLSIGVGLFWANLWRVVQEGASERLTRLGQMSVVVVLAVLVVPGIVSNYRDIRNNLSKTNRMDQHVAEFARYLENRPAGQRDFLAPLGIYIHWRLNEPRYGFPHSANTSHIIRGWWKDLSPPKRFRLPTDEASYCSKLEAEGPSVVVTILEPLWNCLYKSKNYRLGESRLWSGQDVRIFERSVTAQD